MRKKGINRREFMETAALGLASTTLGLPLLKGSPVSQAKNDKIIYRTLGRTQQRIPIISFGVMNSDSPDLLRKALEMGVRHLDTAHTYLRGNSERFIGEVLEEDKFRDKVCIATKMSFAKDRKKKIFLNKPSGGRPVAGEENLNTQLETSLQRLRTDYIDILYLHGCESPQMVTYEPVMNALVKVKKAGKARFLGVSTHANDPEVIRTAVDSGIYDVVLTSYNIMQTNKNEMKKAIQYAAEKDIGIVAMKTHGGNRLNRDPDVEIDHAAALKWILNDKNVCTTIPGMTSINQLEFNFKVMNDLALSEKEKREIKLASMLRGTFYCQNCRFCVSTCPHKVEIPELMRAYMYSEGYGNLIQAEMTVKELPEKQGLEVCQNCSSCSAKCQHGININDRLKALIKQGVAWC
jgi:hypothetical protein